MVPTYTYRSEQVRQFSEYDEAACRGKGAIRRVFRGFVRTQRRAAQAVAS